MEDVRRLKGSPLKVEYLPSEPWEPPKPEGMTNEEYTRKVAESKENTAKEYWVYSDMRVYFNFNDRVLKTQPVTK